MLLVLISVILLHLCHLCQNVDIDAFCAIECLDKADIHTICEYKCKEDPQRCTDFKHFPLDNHERQMMLDLHNIYRNKVASGEDTRGGNGAAKDMIALNYDVDIEVTTYCWGKRCYFNHDKCRHLPKYTSAGQNLFIQSSTLPSDGKKASLLNISVRRWYDEIEDTSRELLLKYVPIEKMVGHFTQLVWGKTEFMGCSRVTWTAKDIADFKFKYHMLCNYSPAGNFYYAPVYEFGTGCSPPRSANDIYPALCGETKKLEEPDEDDDEEEFTTYKEKFATTSNGTENPMKSNALQNSRRSTFLSWICLISYMNRRLCCSLTTY